MINKLKEIIAYRDMIGGLVKRDLRGRYKGSVLGFIWNFINPMCQIAVYIVIFSMVFPSGIEYYPIYLIVGMMPWNFFAESIKEGAGSIVHQADLTKKIFFPREVLVIATVFSRFINFIITYTLVFGIIIVSGFGYNIKYWIFIPAILIAELIFCLGVALLLSGINVYFRDVEHIIGVLLMAWVWGTPIMYSIDLTGDGILRKLVHLNPMTWFVEIYHDILYLKTCPSIAMLGACFLIAFLFLVIGELCFNYLEGNFAEEL